MPGQRIKAPHEPHGVFKRFSRRAWPRWRLRLRGSQFLQGTPVALPPTTLFLAYSIGQGRVLMRGEGGESGVLERSLKAAAEAGTYSR